MTKSEAPTSDFVDSLSGLPDGQAAKANGGMKNELV